MLSSRRLARTLFAIALCGPIAAASCATSDEAETIEFGSPKDDASAGTSGSGSGGSSGTTGGTGGSRAGSCSVAFCPSGGQGAPCCLSPDGPCGVNLGTGCALPQAADF